MAALITLKTERHPIGKIVTAAFLPPLLVVVARFVAGSGLGAAPFHRALVALVAPPPAEMVTCPLSALPRLRRRLSR